MTPEVILARNNQVGRPFVTVTRGEHGATIYARAGVVQTPVVPPLAILTLPAWGMLSAAAF